MPSAFKLVMLGTFQKGLCSHLKSQQEQMGGRSTLQAGTCLGSCWETQFVPLNCLSTFVKASACTEWNRFRVLVALSAWCTPNQETKPSMGFGVGFFPLLTSLKGILKLTENEGLSVPCWTSPGGIERDWKAFPCSEKYQIKCGVQRLQQQDERRGSEENKERKRRYVADKRKIARRD